MHLEIGQTVWRFNENRRVYTKDTSGSFGTIIWREHWEPLKVYGETSRSWLIGYPHSCHKLPKNKPMVQGWAFSKEEIDRAAFVEKSHLIADFVRSCRDYEKLVQIANLVGFPKERE